MGDLSGLLGTGSTYRRPSTPVAPRPPSPSPYRPSPPTTAPPVDPRIALLRAHLERVGGTSTPEPPPTFTRPAMPVLNTGGKSGAPSLAQQGSRILAGIPQGIASLVGMGAKTVAAVPRAGIDIARGNVADYGSGLHGDYRFDENLMTPKLKDYIEQNQIPTRTGGLMKAMEDYNPLPTLMAKSLSNTGGRTWDVARHGDISAYKQASDEGRILDVILEDVGNIGMTAGVAGKAAGTVPKTVSVDAASARALGAGKSSSAGAAVNTIDDLSRVRSTPVTGLSAAERTVSSTGAVVPLEQTVTIPGTGLAGALHRAGYEGAALTTQTAGRGVATVGRLGQAVDDAQLAIPFKLAGKGLKGVGGPVLRRLGTAAEKYGASHEGRMADLIGGFGPAARTDARQIRRLQDKLHRDLTGQERAILRARNIQEAYNVDAPQARAALFDVDDRFRPLVDEYRKGLVDDATFDSVIERAYSDTPAELRPVLADVKAWDDWQHGRLDPDVADGMNQIEREIRQVSERFTQQGVAAGKVKQEWLEPEHLPDEVVRVRSKLERPRDAAARNLDVETARAARVVRVADANDAIMAELPPPPDPKHLVGTGKQAGIAEAQAAAMRQEHKIRQNEVKVALNRYEKAVAEAADSPITKRLAKELERKVTQAETLRAEITRTSRRVDAAMPLSKVTERVAGEGLPTQQAKPTPHIDFSQMETPAAMKRVANEIQDAATNAARQDIDLISGGDVPDMSDYWREAGKIRPQERIRQYAGGGFLGSKVGRYTGGKVGRGLKPDQFAVAVSARVGRTLDINQALEMYFGALDRYFDAKLAGGDLAVTRLSDDFGLTPESVRIALTGSAADFRNAVIQETIAALDDVKAKFGDMEPSVADSILAELADMRSKGATPEALGDFMYEVLDGESSVRLLEPLWGRVPMDTLVDWVIGGETPNIIYETVIGKRSMPATAQIARMQQRVLDARGELRSVSTDQRHLSTLLDTARQGLDNTASTAAAELERAGLAERGTGRLADALERNAEGYGKAAADAEYNREWKRTAGKDADGNPTAPPSPAERAIHRQGVLRERATARQAVINRLERNIARWNNKIADLPNELERGYVERLEVDINKPALKGLGSTIRATERAFGRLELGSADTPPTVSGVMGELADRYGFTDELVGQLTDEIKHAQDGYMPLNSERAFNQVVRDLGIKLSDADMKRAERSVQADQLLAELDAITSAATETGTVANVPFRVIDHIRQQHWLPDDVKSQLETKWERYANRRGRYLTQMFDDQAAVMPGQWRAVGSNSRRLIRGLLEEAEDAYRRRDPDTSMALMSMAEDVPTTLQQMIDAGIDPTYLTGGKPVSLASGMSGGGLASRKLRGESHLTQGLRPMDLSGVTQLQMNEASKLLANNAVDWIDGNMSRPASAVPEVVAATKAWTEAHPYDQVIPAAELKRVLDDAGYGVTPKHVGETIGPATPVIPKAIANQLKRMGTPNGPGWEILNKGNQVFKTAVLPLSPRWLVGNVVGNAFMAMFNYGMSPLELARLVDDIQKMEGGWKNLWRQGGLASFAPDDLASHGLTYNEHNLRFGDADLADPNVTPTIAAKAGKKFRDGIAKSYNMNEFVDNVGRSAVYLKELRKTGNPEAATRAALNAMGDFTRMSPFERKWARQVFPFYSWMRHQTVAAMRLPAQSPTRAAFLLNLTNMMNDPEYGDDMMAQLGFGINIGEGNFLNIGGMSPFGDPRNLSLDPTSAEFTQGISPIIDAPIKALTGRNLASWTPVSRPPEDRPTDMFGRVEPLSPFRRMIRDPIAGIGEIGYQLSGELPQTRSLRDAMLGPGQFRYQSGDRGPAKYDKPAPPGGRSLDLLLRGLNMPRVEHKDISQLLREQRKREAQNR